MKMNYFVNCWRAVYRRVFRYADGAAARLSRFGFTAVLLLVGLAACRSQAEVPLVVTQTVMVEGEEVVVTRVVLQTIQVPVLATAVADEVHQPVELDISFRGALPSLDTQRAVNSNAITLIENLFVGLTSLDPQTNEIKPELAREWEVSADGRTWTFHLRDDIFWVRPVEPSRFNARAPLEVRAVRQVVAADVVYAIQRLCHPATGTPDVFVFFIIEGCEQAHDTAVAADIAPQALDFIAVQAVNDFTLQITLDRPAAYFLTLTTLWPLRPLPPELLLEHGDRWAQPENIVTSGPFVLSPQSLAGTRTILQRNPFWPLPFSGNVDIVNILYLRNDEESFRLWESRNLDLSPLPAAERALILRTSPTKVELAPAPQVYYLAYNFNSPVFRHPELRRAFGAAINRERLIREVYGGRALPLRHFTPPGTVAGVALEATIGVGYSPDEARLQVAGSSLVNCRFMPPVTYLTSAFDQDLQHAELLREMWQSELGCGPDQIVIEQVQFGALLANTRRDAAGSLRPDLWNLAWSAYFPDAHNWLSYVLHCTLSDNRQNRPCSEADALLEQAAVTHDPEARQQLYRQVERLFFGPNGLEPITPLFVRADYVLRQAWVNYTPAAFGGEQFDTYRVDATVKELERLR